MSMERITVIEKRRSFSLINWKELRAYKDLLYFLVVRGLKARYAQSILGVGWAVLQPLSTMLVFTAFATVTKIEMEGIPKPLFLFCGLTVWTYFSGVLSDVSNSITTNANMISKVYFPRLVLPFAAALAKLVDLFICLVVLALLMVIYGYAPTWSVVWVPLIMIVVVVVSLGPALMLAAWSVQYRDVKHALTFIIQLLMYTAPVVYPISSIPEQYRFWYSLNPVVGVVHGFRTAILGNGPMPWAEMGFSALGGSVMLALGLYTFSRLEKTFADVA